ncbi:hypothetical protein JOD20_005162 [Herpetosiphon giganteus]|nr:hypothetical protein [Herpetosiphon giganteus]
MQITRYTVQLPQPIDPLPAALAALASIPLKDVPTPRFDLPQASRLPFESSLGARMN